MPMTAAVAVRAGAAAEVVELERRERPRPGPGEVVVRMTAATVNPSDLLTIAGVYPSRTVFPFVPGFEGVGVVAATGVGVPENLAGRRVLPIGSAGAWQEHKRVEAGWCVPVPDDIADRAACFAYVNPLTALAMVDLFVPPRTRAAVVTAASSAIAGQLAELLALRGVPAVGLTRGTPGRSVADPGLWAGVVRLGAPGWPRELAALLPADGADVVFDCVGGPLGAALLDRLAPHGRLVQYGLLSGRPIPAAAGGAADPRIVPFHLRRLVHGAPRPQLLGLFDRAFAHLRAGRLATRVGAEHPFGDLRAALRRPPAGGGKPLIVF